MTVHPAVHRNHDTAAFHRFGADIGSDVPVTLEVVDSLHPYSTNLATRTSSWSFSRSMRPFIHAKSLPCPGGIAASISVCPGGSSTHPSR
ncbi:uronate isomerase [Cutibacterium acnes JCM 18916]|nr:uronate isomerase [Cutibacterium acnes JCM 18916]